MKTRVITAVVFVIVLIGVFLLFNTPLFNLIFAAICLIAIHELYKAFQFSPKTLFIYIGFIPMVLIMMLSGYEPIQKFIMPICYLFLLFIVFCVVLGVKKISFEKIGGMTVFSAIIVFCFFSLVNLKVLLPRETYGYDAVYFCALILAYAWGGDTAAYFAGAAFGKRKLAPDVSPKKTVEGAIGGVVGSVLLGIVITLIYMLVFRQSISFGVLNWIYYLVVAGFGVIASLLGILGDLFASAVKRQCGIKDFGTIFPGHGGVLDRFDSVMLIAPLVALAVRISFYYFIE